MIAFDALSLALSHLGRGQREGGKEEPRTRANMPPHSLSPAAQGPGHLFSITNAACLAASAQGRPIDIVFSVPKCISRKDLRKAGNRQ
ncbi:hypothetical protein CMQ_7217 [Grosmannia clavigera kw1407]|uniref:Uncharacterized protein n=1 Tax=Grosmannia clavigera (strain kw1407 / UAMH 11150) TaxID=655863 RepID=F0XQ77_GROCL|nr:uncharacterized protein CMQ_7217 [Grosmannia clavigera kw1407]EFX00215.1 hypothetical protein CMQ_7217 [Grosmannia clavigera kw1407]